MARISTSIRANRKTILTFDNFKKMDKIIQITAGRGPAECTWVAAQVLKKVLEEISFEALLRDLHES
jgi:hypothetical protein